ncbi:hypothetical protein A6V29_18745 [Blastococcus sp. CCUG 61487]|nr:hypothetical protein A6V29_18745 [Blastococcus sp. CCUG 61487]
MRNVYRRFRNRPRPDRTAPPEEPATADDVDPAVAELVALAAALGLGPEQLAGPVQAMFSASADDAYRSGDHLGLPADEARTALQDIADGATADVNGRGIAAQLEALHEEHGADTADLLRRIAAGYAG